MGMMPPQHGPMMWWLGRRRKPEPGPADSGLTGDPTLEPPPEPEGPKDLRGRWLNLKQAVTGTTAALPQVLRLVWDASPGITVGLFATTAIAGVIPAASAFVSKLLINSVVQGILINHSHLPDIEALDQLAGTHLIWNPSFSAVGMIVFLTILQLVLFSVAALLNTVRNITQQLLQHS